MSEKTMKTGITGRISSRGNSVTDDLQVHFSVLNELAARLEEYYAMPAMPVSVRMIAEDDGLSHGNAVAG